MKILVNITRFLKLYSLSDVVKFVLVAGLVVSLALLLFKFLLILFAAGFLIRLIAPYLGFRFSSTRFKHHNVPRFKIVGEEEQRQAKRKMK